MRISPVGTISTVLLVCFAVRGLLAQAPTHAKIPKDTLPAELTTGVVPLGLTNPPSPPAGNETTPERVELGRRLFFDPILSTDRTLACASCHDPARAFTTPDAKALGIGGATGSRNAPTLLNRAFGTSQFWDGRAATLEEQALKPIDSPQELATGVSVAVARLAADNFYQESFAAAYSSGVTAQNLARALAAFQRVLLSGNSPVDRFLASDFSALTDDARQGLWLFESRARCWRCHSGGNFSDEAFHNTGIAWQQDPPDLGRMQVTGDEADRGRFKTPTLRNVAQTSPYMHDGSLATLSEVVEFYNQGGIKNPNLDPEMRPLQLTPEEVRFLVTFLEALSGSLPSPEAPAADSSTLDR